MADVAYEIPIINAYGPYRAIIQRHQVSGTENRKYSQEEVSERLEHYFTEKELVSERHPKAWARVRNWDRGIANFLAGRKLSTLQGLIRENRDPSNNTRAGLFRQRRLTLGGEEFEVRKLQTMFDAEQAWNEQLAAGNLTSNPENSNQTVGRYSSMGEILRGNNYDELPQLFDVYKSASSTGQHYHSMLGPRGRTLGVLTNIVNEGAKQGIPPEAFFGMFEWPAGILGASQMRANHRQVPDMIRGLIDAEWAKQLSANPLQYRRELLKSIPNYLIKRAKEKATSGNIVKRVKKLMSL